MRLLLFATLLIMLCYKSVAHISTYSTKLKSNQITTNAILYNTDAQYEYMLEDPSGWPNEFVHAGNTTKDRISLKYDGSAKKIYTSTWWIEVDFTFLRWNTAGTILTTENGTLRIDYDPVAHTSFTDMNVFETGGGFKTKFTITAIRKSGISSIPADVYIESEIITDRYYLLDPNATTTLGHAFNTTDNTIEFHWDYIKGAEEYDLEWLFVSEQTNSTDLPTSITSKLFQNATRVSTSNQYYRISNIFDEGTVYYRIRAVGRKPDNLAMRFEGNWKGSTGTNKFDVSNTDPYKAWQYSAAFAEDGRLKEVTSYFDASGRNRQSVTLLNTANTAMVADQIYDYEGRPAISTLPAPDPNAMTTLKYHEQFSLNAAGTLYNKSNFDRDDLYDENCNATGVPFKNTAGAGSYYSDNNSLANDIYHSYIPDAQGYPFTQTVFNNEGNVSRQSMAGVNHKISSGHETKYYEATPTQTKLDMLFGNEVGYYQHYKQNVTIDANGQQSINYVDLGGNIIATALSGNSPSALTALASNGALTSTTESFISSFDEATSCYSVRHDYFVSNQGSESTPNPYTFTYTLTQESYNALCASLTRDCVYDLVINIYDECSNALTAGNYTTISGVVPVKPTVVNILGEAMTITSEAFDGGPISFSFPVSFPKSGKYYIEKKLCLNQEAMYEALAEYQNAIRTNPEQECVQSLDAILETYQEELLTSDCYPGGTECEQNCQTSATSSGLAPHSAEWFVYVNNCMENTCEVTIGSSSDHDCSELYNLMVSDMSPNGQYFDNLHYSGDVGSPLPVASMTPTSDYIDNIITTINTYFGSPVAFKNDFLNYCSSNPECPAPTIFTWQYIRDNWQSCYGDYFVKFHPEYCRYTRCQSLQNSSFYDFKLASHDYAWAANGTNHFDGSNWMDLATADPINSVIGTYTVSIASFMSGIKAAAIDMANTAYGTTIPTTVTISSLGSTDQNNIWRMLRSLYLKEKKTYEMAVGCPELCAGSTFVLPNNPNDPQRPYITNCSSYPTSVSVNPWGTSTSVTINSGTLGDDFIIRDPELMDDLNAIDENNSDNTVQVLEEQYDICNEPAYIELDLCDSHAGSGSRVAASFFNCSALTLNVYVPSPGPGLVSIVGNATTSVVSPPLGTCAPIDDPDCNQLAQAFVDAINNYHPASGPDFTAVTIPNSPGLIRIFAPRALGADPNTAFVLQSDGLGINDGVYCFGAGFSCIDPENDTWFDQGVTRECDIFTPNCFCQTLKSIQDAYEMKDDNDEDVISHITYPYLVDYTVYSLNQMLDGLGSSTTVTEAQVNFWREHCELSATLPQPNDYLSGDPNPDEEEGYLVPEELKCDQEPPCLQEANEIAQYNASIEFENQLQVASEAFILNYKKECFKTPAQEGTFTETFIVQYNDLQYHFTLYFYDQANNLTRTIPPRAVDLLTGTELTDVQNHRINPGTYPAVYPNTNRSNNALVTNYKYNTLNQVKESESPDGGKTAFWYDKTGRVRFSQNAKQLAVAATCTTCPTAYKGNYSYTLYDNLGRIKEVGENDEYFYDDPGLQNPFYHFVNDQSFPTQHGWQVTKTYYDTPVTGNDVNDEFAGGAAENLRDRVVATTFEEIEDASSATYNSASHYSYDIHGNVKELIQENRALVPIAQEYKHLLYTYDLISGKVKTVSYQPGQRDQFLHKYEYDADNRVTHVSTSKDNVIWEEDARSFYYLHGPLARMEMGQDKVQAFDYAYTINGWIKTVNANTLDRHKDMGSDGINDYISGGSPFGVYSTLQKGIHSNTGADAFGFSLGYFDDDYTAIDASANNPATTNNTHNFLFDIATLSTSVNNVYNGNIKEMATAMYKPNGSALPVVMPFMVNKYNYDQLNRLKEMNSLFYTNSGFSTAANSDGDYHEAYTYDADGNILSLLRKAYTGGGHDNAMDNFAYQYPTTSNKLEYVYDTGNNTTASFGDYQGGVGWPAENYTYDEIGNLTGDQSEQIQLGDGIQWSVYGKILSITRMSTSTKPDLEFKYDPAGNRICKIVKGKESSGDLKPQEDWVYTYYVRDATGNVMATYERTNVETETEQFRISDHSIYGSSRLGVQTDGQDLLASYTDDKFFDRVRGMKTYEGANHLGNVLVTFSDIKLGVPDVSTPTAVDYYLPDVLSATDYYPFGSSMPGRNYNSSDYRYGFNGKEEDGSQTSASSAGLGTQDYGMRIYNPAIGKFLSVDPITKEYPELTPYQFASNTPIQAIDQDGLEAVPPGIAETAKKRAAGEPMDDTPFTFSGTFGVEKFQYTGSTAMAPVTFIDNTVISLWNGVVGTLDVITQPLLVKDNIQNYFNELSNTPYEQAWANTKRDLLQPGFYEDFAAALVPVAVKYAPKLKMEFKNPLNKIQGKAQKTGTSGHAFTSKMWAYRYAFDPRVSKVTLNLGYKKLGAQSQLGFKWGPRPDVGVKFKNGRVLGIEIASKTDLSSNLYLRNKDFLNSKGISGDVKVKKPFSIFNYIKTD